MSDATGTIIAALIGFIGGLIVAAYTFRQKSEELFLTGLQFLEGGSQKRNLGIAAMELSWTNKRYRRVITSIFVGVASYLLLESKQKDAAHELKNLYRVMKILTSPKGRRNLNNDHESQETLITALKSKKKYPMKDPGLWIPPEKIDNWIDTIDP